MARAKGISPYWALFAVVLLAGIAIFVFNASGGAIVLPPTQTDIGQTISLQAEFSNKDFVGSSGVRAGEWASIGNDRYLYIEPNSFLKDDLRIKLEDMVVGGQNVPYANVRFYTSNIAESSARVMSIPTCTGGAPTAGYFLPDGPHGLPYPPSHDPPILPDGNGIILQGKYLDYGRDCTQLYGMYSPENMQKCLNAIAPAIPSFTARANNVWNGYMFNIKTQEQEQTGSCYVGATASQTVKIGLMFQIAIDDRFSDLGFLVNKTQVSNPDVIVEVTLNETTGEVIITPKTLNETTDTYEEIPVVTLPEISHELPPTSEPTPSGASGGSSGGVVLPEMPDELPVLAENEQDNTLAYVAGAILVVVGLGGAYMLFGTKRRRRR